MHDFNSLMKKKKYFFLVYWIEKKTVWDTTKIIRYNSAHIVDNNF